MSSHPAIPLPTVVTNFVWAYAGGIAWLIITDGPERDTIQWSPDYLRSLLQLHGITVNLGFGIHA